MPLPNKWLTVDPGEDTGWAIWSKDGFVTHGTTKMWDFGDAVSAEVLRQLGAEHPLPQLAEEEVPELFEPLSGISLIVVENFTLYPWELRKGSLDWDEVRTARLIGSLYQACRIAGWDYEQQPAKIKERAIAAGAESYFSHPLRENRHANDATMHGVFRIALEKNHAWTDLSTTTWESNDTATTEGGRTKGSNK